MAGERKLQILQTIAGLLQEPQGEKITTALLAKKLDLSEAALYRHFASKAQMFEGLIAFIEETVFDACTKVRAQGGDAHTQALGIVGMLLQFAVNNKGMTRILIGEALVNEDARLQTQILSILDRLEMTLKDIYRNDHEFVTRYDSGAQANLLMSYVLGRWHFYVRSGFKRSPLEAWQTQASYLAI